jgi:hypothetical protein
MSATNYPPKSMQSCSNCYYFRVAGGWSTCRRSSPVRPLEPNPITSWPIVNHTDWCGEWAPDEEVQ